MRILIVDDSAFARERIARLVMAAGHEAIQAADGQEALKLAAEAQPDAITTDLLMPGMDGLELIKKLHTAQPTLPLIIISADVQEATRQQVLAAGGTAFISKAGRLTDLLEILETLSATSGRSLVFDLLQQDAFTEMMNLTMGQAANALASLLERRVLLTVPKVEIMRLTGLRVFLEQRISVVDAYVRQHFRGGLTGDAILLFPVGHAAQLVRAALHSLGPTDLAFSDVGIGILAEVGNVVLNAATARLGDQLGERLAIGLPTVYTNVPVAAFVDALRADLNDMNHVIILISRFAVGEVDLACYLLFLLPEQGVRRLLESLEAQ